MCDFPVNFLGMWDRSEMKSCLGHHYLFISSAGNYRRSSCSICKLDANRSALPLVFFFWFFSFPCWSSQKSIAFCPMVPGRLPCILLWIQWGVARLLCSKRPNQLPVIWAEKLTLLTILSQENCCLRVVLPVISDRHGPLRDALVRFTEISIYWWAAEWGICFAITYLLSHGSMLLRAQSRLWH